MTPPASAARPERFVFGIPLISRAAAGDWAVISRLFGLTLRSVLAQSDGRFEVCLAAHEVPDCWQDRANDPRFHLIKADWSPESPTAANDDGGAKKWLIKDHLRRTGGGLLMFLDADDLIDRRTVQLARENLTSGHVGALVARGVAIDLPTLRAAALPDPRLYDGPFHELCGSTTIARIDPEGDALVQSDPHVALGSHHEWTETAERLGVRLACLPATGGYLVGTSQNHSETHGPFASWRREMNRQVRAVGAPLDDGVSHGLGVDLDALRAVSRLLRNSRPTGPTR